MKRYLLYGIYGFFGLLVLGALAFKVFQPVQVVPRIRIAPGFALTTQNDERLTNEDLRGKFVLYNFIYTGCPEPCNNLNQTMREIQDRIDDAELGDIPVQLITISFDPENDTPDALAEYAKAQGADPSLWIFATLNDPALLKTIIGGGFEAYYNQKDEGTFTFDPKFVLVDGWGIIRGEYRYQTTIPDTDRILRHMSVMAEEVRNSQGAATLAYEAAHYFLCYTP
jgi:protein SCO1/2